MIIKLTLCLQFLTTLNKNPGQKAGSGLWPVTRTQIADRWPADPVPSLLQLHTCCISAYVRCLLYVGVINLCYFDVKFCYHRRPILASGVSTGPSGLPIGLASHPPRNFPWADGHWATYSTHRAIIPCRIWQAVVSKKHGLILIILWQSSSAYFHKWCAYFPCPFTFTYFVCFCIATTKMTRCCRDLLVVNNG